MIKTIYLLTKGDYADKTIIGVFETIELASFAKEEFDKRQAYKWDYADIEEHELNYFWELERVLTEEDTPTNTRQTPIVESTEDKMIKTIYILTATEDQDKVIVGVFDSIELASFAKEEFDKYQFWERDKSRIEEHALNYDWNLEKFLDQSDKPVKVIDPSDLRVRWYGVD
jgi:hypothetical protein